MCLEKIHPSWLSASAPMRNEYEQSKVKQTPGVPKTCTHQYAQGLTYLATCITYIARITGKLPIMSTEWQERSKWAERSCSCFIYSIQPPPDDSVTINPMPSQLTKSARLYPSVGSMSQI